ncbi:MAG: TonB family protein [Mucilaginibacter sp.]|uniref:TonB family protein n=1 Tax=Mucilaginibacter sp. TaxID=1882438 RepID=UPI003561435D
MDNKRADIQQIQKYLNGELDAKAMHRLEREAQGDPFLMDALEGYGRIKNPQQDNLAALQERLQARTTTKTRRMIPWGVISVAASVIGFAIVIGLLYKENQPVKVEKVAMNQVKSVVPDSTATITDNKAGHSILDTPQQLIADNKARPVKKDVPVFANVERYKAPVTVAETNAAPMEALKSLPDSSAMEDKIMGYMAAKRQDTVLGGDKVITTNNAAALTMLNSKAKGADMTVRPGKPGDNNAYALSQAGLPANLLTGVVLDRTNGAPLPGASVKVVGRSAGTQTDANGKFTLPNVKKDESLSIGYIGYNSKTLDVKNKDSLKVELDENRSSLNEVVLAGRAKKVKNERARPHAGWDAFKKYLKENAVTADGKEGMVDLSFTVNANGSVSNIIVTKSLSATADAKAIDLIKNGPTWSGNTSGKAEDVKVKVAFHQ